MRWPVDESDARAAASKPRSVLAVQKRRAHEKAARAASAVYNVGEKIHYWSKKSNTWVLGIVEAKNEPVNGMPTLYDLRCKRMLVRGVLAKQLRGAVAVAGAGAAVETEAAAPAAKSTLDSGSAESASKRPATLSAGTGTVLEPEAAAPAVKSKLDPGSAESSSKRRRVEEPSAVPPAQSTDANACSSADVNTPGENACIAKATGAVAESSSVGSNKKGDVSDTGPAAQVDSSSSTTGLNKDTACSKSSVAPTCQDAAANIGDIAQPAAKAEHVSSKSPALEPGEKAKDGSVEDTKPSQPDIADERAPS